DFAEVDVVGDDESGDDIGEEASSPGVGEGRCQSSCEGVQSLAGAGGESAGSHRWASFRLGRCNFLREEAFLFLLSSLRQRGNSSHLFVDGYREEGYHRMKFDSAGKAVISENSEGSHDRSAVTRLSLYLSSFRRPGSAAIGS